MCNGVCKKIWVHVCVLELRRRLTVYVKAHVFVRVRVSARPTVLHKRVNVDVC